MVGVLEVLVIMEVEEPEELVAEDDMGEPEVPPEEVMLNC